MGQLEGKVAVITGGGNGIGRAVAQRFAAEGAAVVVADLHPGRDETVATIADAGGRAEAIAVDVTNREQLDAMASLAVTSFGGIDIVVTAAGITHMNYASGDQEAETKWLLERVDYMEEPHREVIDLGLDEFQKVMSVNVDGTFLSIQACLPSIVERGGGSIVTIASIAAKNPDAGPLPYVTSKAAVWMLTKKLARMLAPAQIRVNAIGPGFIDTNMTKLTEMFPEDRLESFWANIPMGRKGTADEIANTALFLASDQASYFTGEILHPDGGYFTE